MATLVLVVLVSHVADQLLDRVAAFPTPQCAGCDSNHLVGRKLRIPARARAIAAKRKGARDFFRAPRLFYRISARISDPAPFRDRGPGIRRLRGSCRSNPNLCWLNRATQQARCVVAQRPVAAPLPDADRFVVWAANVPPVAVAACSCRYRSRTDDSSADRSWDYLGVPRQAGARAQANA